MEPISVIAVLLAGFAAGVINVVAGGGSIITLPVLIFLGLPGAMANGSNRVAILCQNIVAIHKFRTKGYLPLKNGLFLGVCAVLGAILGSLLAVNISGALFKKILSLVMFAQVIPIFLLRNRKISEAVPPQRPVLLMILFFLIGIYGGFIQVGTSFLIIVVLILVAGINMMVANGIKVMVVFMYTIPTLIIFAVRGEIHWIIGIILAIGNMAGAIIGNKIVFWGGEKWIQRIFFLTVIAMSIRLFFFN